HLLLHAAGLTPGRLVVERVSRLILRASHRRGARLGDGSTGSGGGASSGDDLGAEPRAERRPRTFGHRRREEPVGEFEECGAPSVGYSPVTVSMPMHPLSGSSASDATRARRACSPASTSATRP